jgi:uncharacterized protein YcaQ
VRDVTARLRAEGPLTTAHIGGAKRGGEWWDWSESKIAIEWLLDIGTVVVTRREGWRRIATRRRNPDGERTLVVPAERSERRDRRQEMGERSRVDGALFRPVLCAMC